MGCRLRSALATASSAEATARSVVAPAGSSWHRFLVLSLLAGPVGSLALYVGAHLAALTLPHARFGWAGLAMSLLLAPMLEELVFRGGIQDVLDRTPWGRLGVFGGLSVGNVLTSLLFSAAHLMAAPAWLAGATFFPSLVLGRLKQMYSSLVPVVLVHAWFNVCYLTAGAVM